MNRYSTNSQGLKASSRLLFCFSVFFYFCAQPTALHAQESDGETANGRSLRAQLNSHTSSIGIRLPEAQSLDPRVFPFDRTPNRGLSLQGPASPFWPWQPLSLQRKAELDSTGKLIIVRESLNGLPLRLPYLVSFDDYINQRLSYEQSLAWHQAAANSIYQTDDGQRRGPGGLSIDIPVPIKSKAFQQIFGGSSVGLNVQGDIRINGGFRRESRSEVKTAFTRGSDFSFKMNQTQRFTVTGRIGDKVTVNVDQDSERAFDFENNIRLNYTGYEDDIVKKIEAGNIALSLPGTRFVTFGGTSAGLFGLKSEMQLGNLAITAIASQEKGENKRLSLSGGATEGVQRIQDYDYRRYTYFFLDQSYREQFRRYRTKWVHVYDPAMAIDRIEVYKSTIRRDDPKEIDGVAYRHPNPPSNSTQPDATEIERGRFIRLEPNTDYYVEKTLGYIMMINPVNVEEVLAVAYRTANGDTVGAINYVIQPGTAQRDSIRLKLIKPRSPVPSRDPQSTWQLEWKNVYYLGSRNIPPEDFELKIFFKPSSGNPEENLVKNDRSISYLNIFGLDERDNTGAFRPDNVIDNDQTILNLARGELIFPDLTPFNPAGVFVDSAVATPGLQPIELPPEKRVTAMYDTTAQAVIYSDSKFYLEVKSKNRSSNYSLGFNVIENSEEVLLNGRRLARDQDYIIDYFSGNLTILNEEASKPNASVEVSYQSNSLFQLEKKTILGARAEYRLNPNSFIGGTLLYLNERTLDQRVRLGSVDKGPMRNLIWDVNTAMRFEPDFLTRALNALPFISTQEPSDLRIEGEIAQIIPNPNTLNSTTTGDNDGVAYIDDFEASKRTTPLGVHRRGWVQASIPDTILNKFGRVSDATRNREREALARRGKLIWYNPFSGSFSGVPTREIWPNRDVNAGNKTTQVLELAFTPVDTTGDGLIQSWGGIMRALSAGFFDQTESKFLEIWFQGTKGRLHIDLGQISEDIIPNSKLNSEDELIPGRLRNNILEDDEDVGIDGIKGQDPNDFWDVNGNGKRDWGEPASDDDWLYSSGSNQYARINGTENSKNDANEGGGSIRPDTEDINGNGGLDLANNYFSYTFELDRNHPDRKKFLAGGDTTGSRYGWVLYRIPLNDTTLISSRNRRDFGRPDFTRIEYVRIWVDGFSAAKPDTIKIAEISLVGNEWKEIGIGKTDGDLSGYDRTDPRLDVTIVNTEENPSYVSPPGVQREQDRITLLFAKEQSQVIHVDQLDSNEIAVAQKTFFQPLNLINYNRVKMFVYGRDDRGRHMLIPGAPDSSAIVFFIRLGADDRNYYEIREMVFPGWDRRNEMAVDLVKLTGLKVTLPVDSLNRVPGSQPADDYYRTRISATQELRIRGNPSLTNVRTLIAGVKNLSPEPFSGEVWMDELRVSEVKKDKGMAMRVRADLKLADFMTLNGEINQQDADFHNVAERFGRGDNRVSYTLAGSMAFDKILPQSWGLTVPVSMNYTESRATPKYLPGRDIEVTGDLPTSVMESIRAFNNQLGFNISVRRRVKSQNFLVKNTIDNLAGSLSYTSSHLTSSQMVFSDRTAWSGDLSYNLAFGNNNFIKPFAWIGNAPLLGKLTNTKLYYTPQNFSAQLQATNTKNASQTRVVNTKTGITIPGQGVRSNQPSYTAIHSYRTSMKLVESMTVDFSRAFTNDLLSKARRDSTRTEGLFGLLTGNYDNVSTNQSFALRYTPNIFSWLNQNLSYSSNYRYTNNIQQREIGRSAGTSANFTASSTLRFAQLLQSFKSKSPTPRREAPGRTREAPRPIPGEQPQQKAEPGVREEEGIPEKRPEEQPPEERTPPGQAPKEEDKKKAEQKQKESEPGRGISLADLLGFLGKFKDISVTYSRRDNYSNNALQEGTPNWRYQFGFTRNPDIPQVPNVTTVPSSYQRGDNYSVQTGLDISRSFNLSLRLEHDEQRNESTTITGSSSDTWLRTEVLKLPGIPDVDIPFPEWTINWSGLERIKLFNKFASSLSLSHSFGGKKTSIWNGAPDRITSEDFSFNFRPLIKINLSWKNGMISSFQYNKTTGDRPTYNPINGEFQGSSLTRNSDISFTTTYSKRSGFRLPLPFLKNKELKNSVDLSITFLKSTSVSSLKRGFGPEANANETKRWSLRPSMTYSFSNRVRGGAFFEIGKTESKLSGTTNIKELGIDVNISIRGE